MPSKENGTIRPDFLVHWTGREIHANHRNLNNSQRKYYVNRLCSTLHEGLWMTYQTEQISLPEYGIAYDTAMTCFTETRLSVVEKHTEAYGCLGFGFSRDFILGLFGAPVRYIAATTEDRITKYFSEAVREIVKLHPQGSAELKSIFDYLKPSIMLLKPMSKCTAPHDFVYLDESEWRVMYFQQQQDKQDKVVSIGKDKHPIAKINFDQSDLKILIIPDDETRKMALSNKHIWNWLSSDLAHLPIIITVAECLHF